MIPRRFSISVFVCMLSILPCLLQAQDGIDPELLAGMKARSIGPAGMSGRIAAVEALDSNPDIIYIGAATGGVWKSVNGGITWSPIFDKQSVAAIGAIEVFQPTPDIVWVGTGEGNVRNSASVGDGVYKSLDGGRTWENMGLGKSERIGRIVTHPSNPNIVYVAALGQAWGENPDRGIFKTEDGGKTWKKILYVDEKTGAADLIMDPSNPDKLFAAMWQYRRWPWFFNSGGPGSGLYFTIDGGSNWEKLTEEDGLPKGELGRIGIGISRSYPNTVYALVEAEKSALIRSEDGGLHWKTMNDESDISGRPFYYADIRVDPEFPNRVYSLQSLVRVSNDSGKTFQTLVTFAMIHPDHHALWINPNNPAHLILGNDGGVAFSQDRGKTWRFVGNLPVAQYYHIRVDMDNPYHVYGGMQDNGSWRGPNTVWESDGIRNQYWDEVGFGDGFDTVPDPGDSMKGYSMSQEGYLVRWDLRTGERKDIRPPAPEGIKLRFNWNAGMAIDPFDGNTIYYGSQFLHKSMDRGETWKIISPDLTTNNSEWQKQFESGGLTPDVTGAENFTTIVAIEPSPIEKNLIWIGTDDGRIQLTRDSGDSWTSLEKNVKGVPPGTWIPHITASKYAAGTAYVTFDDHRRSNWTTYVYKTTDYGNSWKNLATPEINGYALSLAEDTVKPDLLFLGTEFGLYVSLNGGNGWMKWKHGFPTVSSMDLLVHPREQDLVIATHGRAAYILDDIRPLRTLSPTLMKEPIHLFEIPDAQQYWIKQAGGSRFPGQSEFTGENRPYGAIITFSLNAEGLPHPDDEKEKELKEKERQAAPESVKNTDDKSEEKDSRPKAEIKITDPQGKIIRTFKSPVTMGVNRTVWDLCRDAFHSPPDPDDEPEANPSGPEVLPGLYTVSLKYKDHEAKGTVKVVADPRFHISDPDRLAKWNAILKAGQLQEINTSAILQIRSTRSDIDTVVNKIKEAQKSTSTTGDPKSDKDSPQQKLVESAEELRKQLTKMEKKLWVPPKTKGYVPETDVQNQINYALSFLSSSWDKPTEAQLIQIQFAEKELNAALGEFNKLYADQVNNFRQQVKNSRIMLLPETSPILLNAAPPTQSKMEKAPMSNAGRDIHSFSHPDEVIVTHLDLELNVDFQSKQLSGRASLTINNLTGTNQLYLDTRDLTIDRITLGSDGAQTSFHLGEPVRWLGRPLIIDISPDTRLVNIYYKTSPGAAALQWLEPAQTSDGKFPFLFTQSQAALARTWIPCQDTPGVRMTYTAKIIAPPGLMAVMSAENETKRNPDGVYQFQMPQAIPSYLLALAVGDIDFRSTGPRSGVYAEPSVVDQAAWEFADTEKMIAMAEKLYGPYKWGEYDLMVLPPSFPYGGMENPRLTFTTTTIITGDRSLVSLVAHELAHSWSGNLVTNATWEDFWLNEGFTTYFQHRIMEALYGRDHDEMQAVLGLQELQKAILEFGETSSDTHLKLDLKDRDPDDSFSAVAYQKGYYFLRTIEETVGRQQWDTFLREYFNSHEFQSVTTEEFLAYLQEKLIRGDEALAQKLQIEAWVYGPGIPSNSARPHSNAFNNVEAQIKFWSDGTPSKSLDTEKWTTQQWIHFLRNLPEPLQATQMAELDATFHFSTTRNAEIMNEWLILVIDNHYQPGYPTLEHFLTNQGRRRYLKPLYTEMAKTPEGFQMATAIYSKARATYHPVSVAVVDSILKWQGKPSS